MLLLFSLGCAPSTAPRAAHSPDAPAMRGAWTVAKLIPSDGGPSDYFGTDVAPAGDVDRDGLPDILVSAPLAGQVYLYYGTTSGYSTDHEQILSTTTLTNRFGNSVGPGDFDGDGFADLAVGAHEDSSSAITAGAAALFTGSAAGLSSAADLRPGTNTFQQQFGYDIASADFNGDGYDDAVFSAHGDSSADTYAGAVYAYYGSATGIETASEQRITASDAALWDSYGMALRPAGDIDGDGYTDLIVGAAGVDPSGAAYVYYGSATGIETASEDRIPHADKGDSGFGFTVSGAGDVNGDGYDDVLVGIYDFFSQGTVYVYHGSAAGIETTPSQRIVASDVSVGDQFGLALAGAGDVDRDGYGDILISAMLGGGGGVYVYYGSATGIETTSEEKLTTTSGGGSAIFGASLAGAGDLNGDGVDDILIGASFDAADGAGSGAAYVYYGSCTDDDSDGLCALDDCDDLDPKAGLPLVFYADTDADGYGDAGSPAEACSQPSGYTADSTDCDDGEAAAFPGNPELCDGVDNDCDTLTDEDASDAPTWYADADADGYGDPAQATASCTQPSGAVDNRDDCDDTDPAAYPGAEEVPDDGIDQDCDGADLISDPVPEDTGQVQRDPAECRGMGWTCATGPRRPAGWLVLAGLLAGWRRRRS